MRPIAHSQLRRITAVQSAALLFDIVSVQNWTRRRFSARARHCASGGIVSPGETASRSSRNFSNSRFPGAYCVLKYRMRNRNLAIRRFIPGACDSAPEAIVMRRHSASICWLSSSGWSARLVSEGRGVRVLQPAPSSPTAAPDTYTVSSNSARFAQICPLRPNLPASPSGKASVLHTDIPRFESWSGHHLHRRSNGSRMPMPTTEPSWAGSSAARSRSGISRPPEPSSLRRASGFSLHSSTKTGAAR